MDHQEQQHQHHEKERELKKKEHKKHELEQEKAPRRIHPGWFVIVGAILIGLVIIVWTFMI